MYFLIGLVRARAARPLLAWVVAVLLYALLPVPQQWVLFLVVGLGVALAVTVRRLREGGRAMVDHAGRAWGIADRLSTAVEDRIRQTPPPPRVEAAPSGYYVEPPAAAHQLTAGGVYGPGMVGPVYDPGALLSAIAAVLAAEGLPVSAAAALGPCADLLSWQGISIAPNVPAPTARALATRLAPGAPRHRRAVPPGLFATCITAVLIADGVMPLELSTSEAQALIDAAARILETVGIAPDPYAGGAAELARYGADHQRRAARGLVMGTRALLAAVVFAVLMGALTNGGWWWVVLAALAFLVLGGRVRLPLTGVRLSAANRFILRENQRTRRDNRRLARQRRRRARNERRAMRDRKRQAQ
jgi:hypothetical protein